MKQKKIERIINEAIGFIHLMSDDTVSKKAGKRVIKRLHKVKFCNLHFVGNNEALESSSDGVAVCNCTTTRQTNAINGKFICCDCNKPIAN